ncbi:MAG: hypothetical protein NC911_01895, partial [Candidatus Omnitrophica bacterium]|nr:hypothetical protein [Candidatus Omnitrophota bacterium]
MVTAERNKKFNWWLPVVLSLAVVLVYLNSLSVPLFWDDQALIVENPYIKDFRNIRYILTSDLFRGGTSAFYRPMQTIFYGVIYHLFKLSAPAYHWLNIVLHGVATILLFTLLSQLYPRFVSFFATLIWAVHPLHTEAVTYVSGTADPLSVAFGLG